jgi:inorganic pyrophosphatase
VNAIIEAPKGSRTKFKYDDEHGTFLFDKMLPLGQTFPFDFGFLPSTRGGDGDPLDVLVLTEEPTFVGCLIHARLVGVIEAEQIENRQTSRNDRIIGVPIEAKSGKAAIAKSALVSGRLPPALGRKISQFFVAYNHLQGREFKILRIAGPDHAAIVVRDAMTKSRKR